jgi:hypothetical protein
MDDGDQPVSIVPDVKDHVVIDMVGILQHRANFCKIVPSDCFDDAHPNFDLVRRIRVFPDRFTQMLTRHNMHWIQEYFTNCEVVEDYLASRVSRCFSMV